MVFPVSGCQFDVFLITLMRSLKIELLFHGPEEIISDSWHVFVMCNFCFMKGIYLTY